MAKITDPALLESRAKREAHREKQREANIGRAKKMHEARLALEAEESGTMPPAEERDSPFHVGCSGWFYWDWRGKFYPADMPTGQWFGHYAAHFNTVELNAPFYSWPTFISWKISVYV